MKYLFIISQFIFLSTIIVALEGCSTPNAIEAEDHKVTVENINVAFSIRNPQWYAVIDRNDHIISICDTPQQCINLTSPDYDSVAISASQIGLVGYRSAGTTCGEGKFRWENRFFLCGQGYNDEKACASKFFESVSHSDWSQGSLFSPPRIDEFIPSLLQETAAKTHLRDLYELLSGEFPQPAVKLAQVTHKNKIPRKKNKYQYQTSNKSPTLEPLYIDADHLDDAFKALSKRPIWADNVVLFNEPTLEPIAVVKLREMSDEPLPEASNRQFSEIINMLLIRAESVESRSGIDINKLIPPEVPLPSLPPEPELVKSEFETEAEFKVRCVKAVTAREDDKRNIELQYKSDIENRNQYIAALEVAWQKFLDDKASKLSGPAAKLKANQARMTALLYAMNWGRFTVSDYRYDAETQSLYFIAASTRYGFKQKMSAHVAPESAKLLKEKNDVIVAPVFDFSDGKLNGKGFVIQDRISGDSFAADYTDKNYKPVNMVAAFPSLQDIHQKRGVTFAGYKQKAIPFADNEIKGIAYINTAKRINARMPDWYSSPEQSGKILGFGQGDSPEEASQMAKRDLSSNLSVTVSSEIDITRRDNTISSYAEMKQQIHQKSDVQFKTGDLSIYKQAESDGRYYVAICYRCESI